MVSPSFAASPALGRYPCVGDKGRHSLFWPGGRAGAASPPATVGPASWLRHRSHSGAGPDRATGSACYGLEGSARHRLNDRTAGSAAVPSLGNPVVVARTHAADSQTGVVESTVHPQGNAAGCGWSFDRIRAAGVVQRGRQRMSRSGEPLFIG